MRRRPDDGVGHGPTPRPDRPTGGAATDDGRRAGRRRILRAFVAAGIGVVAGGGAHGYLYERHRIGITRASLPVSGLPEALDGLRVALLTDFHLTGDAVAHDIEQAVKLTQAEQPDIIVLGGDYVTLQNRRFMDPCAQLLAPLTAPSGVYAVLGNHDDEYEMPRALRRHGLEVLDDERTVVTIRGETLDLIGLRFWTRQASELARLMRAGAPATVLLTHTPSRLPMATALNIPLMLCGHTHGGQIVVPGLGPIAGRRFPVIEGMERVDNTTVFVSRGIGTVYVPCRINCPPEVAMLTLKRLAHPIQD
jgi:uncharacterized protein